MSRLTPADEGNVAVVRLLVESVLGAGRMALLPRLIAPEYVGHLPIGDHYGPEGVRIELAAYRSAMCDLDVTLDDLFGWDDRVARRFTLRGMSRSVPPAEPVPVILHGIAIDRLKHGRLVESWVQIEQYPRAE